MRRKKIQNLSFALILSKDYAKRVKNVNILMICHWNLRLKYLIFIQTSVNKWVIVNSNNNNNNSSNNNNRMVMIQIIVQTGMKKH